MHTVNVLLTKDVKPKNIQNKYNARTEPWVPFSLFSAVLFLTVPTYSILSARLSWVPVPAVTTRHIASRTSLNARAIRLVTSH